MSRDMGDKRKSVAIDLDGTLAEYSRFVNWDIIGRPRKGAKKALQKFKEAGWVVIIHTTRGDVNAVWAWLQTYQLHKYVDYVNANPENIRLRINLGKPIARIYIDDRAYPFCGERPIVWSEIMKDLSERGILE